MRNVTYFPPYSQKENVITNSVLILLSQLNQRAPDIFSRLLTELSDSEFNIGPIFSNQIKLDGGKSIPDAIISQEPFNIYIETKLGDDLDELQIESHCKAIERSNNHDIQPYLMGITRSELSKLKRQTLEEQCSKYGVRFISASFIQIADTIEELSDNFRLALNNIIEEYRTFIHEQQLSPINNNILIINPCGTSYKNNILYGLYHDQPKRSKIPCRYLGLYKDKKVGHIGEVQAMCLARVNDSYEVEIIESFVLSWNNNELMPINEEWKKRISDLVKSTDYYDLKNEVVRFSIVEEFLPTNYKKTSKGGIQGHRYFDLGSAIEEKYDTIPEIFLSDEVTLEKITAALNGKEWK